MFAQPISICGGTQAACIPARSWPGKTIRPCVDVLVSRSWAALNGKETARRPMAGDMGIAHPVTHEWNPGRDDRMAPTLCLTTACPVITLAATREATIMRTMRLFLGLVVCHSSVFG